MRNFQRKFLKSVAVIAASFACLSVQTLAAVTEPFTYTYSSYQEAVPIPDFYLGKTRLSGEVIGCGSFQNPRDLFVDDNGYLYICDTGNDRIVILDDQYTLVSVIEELVYEETGETTTLSRPNGLFVDGDRIIVADTESERILYCDRDGKILREVLRPEHSQFSGDTLFLPTKVLVDRQGNLYAQCEGFYQGLVMFDENGEFLSFFGSESVFASVEVQLQYFWQQLMSQEQKDQTSRYVPTEIMAMTIDRNGYIYTIAQQHSTLGVKNEMDNIRKLNTKGKDILVNKMPEAAYTAFKSAATSLNMVDIAVDEQGFITIIDSSAGKVMYFDKEMNLLAMFGSIGYDLNEYQLPMAVDCFGSSLYILDQTTNTVTVLQRTEFGETVCNAVSAYHDGNFADTIGPWNDVISQSANYEFAYSYLGNAYLSQGEYEKARDCFALGRDSRGYNEAYKHLRTEGVRDILLYVVPVAAVVIVALIIVRVVIKKRKSR